MNGSTQNIDDQSFIDARERLREAQRLRELRRQNINQNELIQLPLSTPIFEAPF